VPAPELETVAATARDGSSLDHGAAPERDAAPFESRPSTRVASRSRKSPNSRGDDATAIWNGLVRAPDRPETRLRESLLYPLWGATGVAFLVFLPPLLWFVSIPFITAVTAFWGTDTPFRVPMLLVLIPSSFGLGAVLGYALLFLGSVVAASAMGQVHHPHRPDFTLSNILFGLGRWLWAGLIGGVVGGIPAVAYWIYCGDIDFFDTMILAELSSVGAAYALMALLASMLREDWLAANPITVVGAILKVGWSYAPPCLLAGVALVLAVTVLAASFSVSSSLFSAVLLWAFWVVALYEAMVVCRVLGLLYRKYARDLGWFRQRTGWGV
jgi:hypothetical protein